MGIFDRFRTEAWDLAALSPPWGERPSIYEHVLSGRPGDLPDEPTGAEVRFAPGAMDGVLGHHAEPGDATLRAKQLVKALRDLLSSATARNFAHLYEIATREPLLPVIDFFLEEVSEESASLDVERFVTLARCLVHEAADRDAVKLGMAMLGLVRGEGAADAEDDEALRMLGLHDELTLYAVVALLARGTSERTLFEMAQQVRGWGRIEIVERLEETRDPEIQSWLLREGWQNDVMVEYTALPCAMAGGLAEALGAERVDDALLRGAGEILVALIHGPPGPGIEAYPEAHEAVARFVAHVTRTPITPERRAQVEAIRGYLAELDAAQPELVAECNAYLAD